MMMMQFVKCSLNVDQTVCHYLPLSRVKGHLKGEKIKTFKAFLTSLLFSVVNFYLFESFEVKQSEKRTSLFG